MRDAPVILPESLNAKCMRMAQRLIMDAGFPRIGAALTMHCDIDVLSTCIDHRIPGGSIRIVAMLGRGGLNEALAWAQVLVVHDRVR